MKFNTAFALLVTMLTIESRFDVVASSSSSNLDGSDPQATRKTRVLKPKNANSCQQQQTTIAGLEREVVGLEREVVGMEREVIGLEREVETCKSSLNDDGGYGSPVCTDPGEDAYATGSKLPCCDGKEAEKKPCPPPNYSCFFCPDGAGPAPSPSPPSPSSRSTKCGVATNLLTDQVVKELDNAGGLAFYTGWKADPYLPLDPSSTGMEFVSWAASPDGNWNGPSAGGFISTMLLGVNEPDGDKKDGSQPISPERYAQLWPTIVDNARDKGYTEFAGPQLTGGGLDWQVRFMKALDQELDALGKDDKSSYLTYVSYHVYEPFCKKNPSVIASYYKGQMDAWKNALAPWWTEYGIQGFVLSEFAGAPWEDACDAAGQMKMVQEVLPKVLSMPDVKHLAWFSDVSYGGDNHNQAHYLWKENSLTNLGKAYLNVCNSDGGVLGGPTCTEPGVDAWKTGSYQSCCDGRETELKQCGPDDYCDVCPDGASLTPSLINYGCETTCTGLHRDPYCSGDKVPCCKGLQQVLFQWDGPSLESRYQCEQQWSKVIYDHHIIWDPERCAPSDRCSEYLYRRQGNLASMKKYCEEQSWCHAITGYYDSSKKGYDIETERYITMWGMKCAGNYTGGPTGSIGTNIGGYFLYKLPR